MLSEHERERYRRQTMLFGEEGQEKLKRATVFVAGAGGLGCPVALYLAAAGIGHIRIADCDTVETTNLNRQVLHWDRDVGRAKVASAGEKLAAVNPEIEVETARVVIDASNVADLAGDADVIVDAMDNFETRYLLNEVALARGIPLVHGAISGFFGQATTIIPEQTPCLRCIFPTAPPKETFPVVGTTPGVIGLVQANEVIKYLTGTGDLLAGRLLLWDGTNSTMETIAMERQPKCPACGHLHEKVCP
ncbi:MAG: HesA/MoeB/ThiF family protein [Methanofollis sp.]|uniref:HesA/MoeB/ThiF family protein n=1 Tax=Methanofollis sp. TaxID=2052835 RepID=UPI002602DBCB|nr:HesA/MoeB/ThiF family protein [Methanofollis sp.]MDD4255320.1 HesA/MoeB/ThiF family protein [Methanofollis sp.]